MHLNRVKFLAEEYPTLDNYPFCLDLFRNTQKIAFQSPVTFFIGENGTGKSTLLEAICHRSGYHIWRGVQRTRYEVNPYEDELYRFIRLKWVNGMVPGSFFAADIFRNFAKNLDEWSAMDPGMLKYFGGKSLMSQSHGQSLMSLFRARYKIKGLYLLDEPETALSPKSQLELLGVLQTMSRKGHAQFIIATHSPILLACPDADILDFNTLPIASIAYEETEYFRIYRDFLNDRSKFLPQRRESSP
ncbi:MAG: AAA family ATPase [Deltaproteobacteria bacterium]|nr:AAA family ATPase [Deltaproteobacteria bacterium]